MSVYLVNKVVLFNTFFITASITCCWFLTLWLSPDAKEYLSLLNTKAASPFIWLYPFLKYNLSLVVKL